jgi:predicted RNA-binding protein with PIN domain
MTNRELHTRLQSLYTQIHYNVIYEKDLLQDMSKRELSDFRDKILDEILSIQRYLGIRY